ncbi:hypothetical protein H0H87_009469, partial [Tephrocybe sp. NHM501043]
MDVDSLPASDTLERLAPFIWALRALENLAPISSLNDLTFDIPFSDLERLASFSIWDDMDSTLAAPGSFERLRCVTLRLQRSFYSSQQ